MRVRGCAHPLGDPLALLVSDAGLHAARLQPHVGGGLVAEEGGDLLDELADILGSVARLRHHSTMWRQPGEAAREVRPRERCVGRRRGTREPGRSSGRRTLRICVILWRISGWDDWCTVIGSSSVQQQAAKTPTATTRLGHRGVCRAWRGRYRWRRLHARRCRVRLHLLSDRDYDLVLVASSASCDASRRSLLRERSLHDAAHCPCACRPQGVDCGGNLRRAWRRRCAGWSRRRHLLHRALPQQRRPLQLRSMT